MQVQESFTVNDLLTVASDETLDLEGTGTLTVNDDFENNGDFTPGSNNVAFEGGTDTGEGNPGDQNCNGIETSDGDCEQDLFGSGNFSFGPIDIDLDDTRVVLSQAEAASVNTPEISTLTIDPGNDNSNVQFVLNDSDLDITGDINNNGSFSAGEKLVSFVGGTTQTLSSPDGFNFSRARVSNGSDPALTLNSTKFRVDSLDIEQGRFLVDSGDTLIVRRKIRLRGGNSNRVSVDVTNDARGVLTDTGTLEYYDSDDDGTLDGRVVGTLVKRRTFETAAGWRYVASPLGTSDATETFEGLFEQGQNTNDLWTQGFTGSDAPDAGAENSNALFYDETADGAANQNDDGWTSISDISNSMDVGKGYGIYAFADDNFFESGTQGGFDKTIDAAVEPADQTSFDFTSNPGIDVTDNEPDNSEVDADEGWNLLGNPFLATIDWDDFSRAGFDDVVYVWDFGSETYATWSTSMQSGSGTGSTLDEGRIAPLQAFFVKADTLDAADRTLKIDDITTAQADTGGVFLKSTSSLPPVVSFDLTLDDRQRATTVGFLEGATAGKDARGDGYLLRSNGGGGPELSLYSLLDNGDALTINALPRDLSEERVVPLGVMADGCRANGTAFGGEATLSWPTLRNIPADWTLTLVDTKTEDQYDLKASGAAQHTFTLESDTTDSGCSTSKRRSAGSAASVPSPGTPSVLSVATQDKSATSNARFELRVTPGSARPMELNGFSGEAKDQRAELTWSTAFERSENQGFEVQHKFGETASFSTLKFVESSGASSEASQYQYTTDELEAGTHTFRLKQVSTDGSSSFSEPVTVDVGLNGTFKFSTYPNPVRQQATVEFAVKEKGPVTISLYNTLGQRVRTLYQDTPPAEQLERLQLTTDQLSSGMYFLRMTGPSVSTTRQITVVQ